MFESWFGKGRSAAMARKAELRGELVKAIELYAEAGLASEAARVMVMRGDAEAQPKDRLVHYTQAASTAPDGHEVRKRALKKRGQLILAMAGDAGTSATARLDLIQAAKDFEAAGEQELAAQAYRRAGDTDNEARALAQAGDVEKLEFLLAEQAEKDRGERRKREAHQEIELLVACGRRREALAAAEAIARAGGTHERAQQIASRRAKGPVARLAIRGQKAAFVLGDEIVVGRTEGAIQVASNAISRRHLLIARGASGVFARDLASRNGTLLRGLAIAGDVPIGEGVELRLGKEVPMRIAPRGAGVEMELAGTRYVAPLGGAELGIDGWRLEQAADGWLELVAANGTPAYLGVVELVPRATLLVGDEIATERGGPAVLKVEG